MRRVSELLSLGTPAPSPWQPSCAAPEIAHPGRPLTGPKFEAEVLRVGPGRREHVLLGCAGEQLGGRPKEAGRERAH